MVGTVPDRWTPPRDDLIFAVFRVSIAVVRDKLKAEKAVSFGGFNMQKSVIVAATLVVAAVALSGCFHHSQTSTVEYSPPPRSAPLK